MRNAPTPHRVHLVKVPTHVKGLFLYSHYSDVGHDPFLEVERTNDGVRLSCSDLFKFKPNVQRSPRTRIDVYIPGSAATGLGADILSIVGRGRVAEVSTVDPEDFRAGPQSLPVITESRRLRHDGARAVVAGLVVASDGGSVFLDQEAPNEGHVEMQGPEVHIGVPLEGVYGKFEPEAVTRVAVPAGELRVAGERNPLPKAPGDVEITFTRVAAADLAVTLLHYGQRSL